MPERTCPTLKTHSRTAPRRQGAAADLGRSPHTGCNTLCGGLSRSRTRPPASSGETRRFGASRVAVGRVVVVRVPVLRPLKHVAAHVVEPARRFSPASRAVPTHQQPSVRQAAGPTCGALSPQFSFRPGHFLRSVEPHKLLPSLGRHRLDSTAIGDQEAQHVSQVALPGLGMGRHTRQRRPQG